jgi:hypothetical protein
LVAAGCVAAAPEVRTPYAVLADASQYTNRGRPAKLVARVTRLGRHVLRLMRLSLRLGPMPLHATTSEPLPWLEPNDDEEGSPAAEG